MRDGTKAPRRRADKAITVPTESQEQAALFEWADEWAAKRFPELKLLHHIPNGGNRPGVTGAILKREGVKPGVPDISLPVARGPYHGLYIELKRTVSGKISKAQQRWLDALTKEGYRAVVCLGFGEAKAAIERYLQEDK
jgi:hypothetical protein